MSKTLKKTLSIILTILMIVSAMPMAFAADHTAHALSEGGEAVEFTAYDGKQIIQSDASYYLTEDVDLAGFILALDGATLNLCLNGHKLNLNGNYMSFGSGTTLNICDCAGGGCITDTSESGTMPCISLSSNSSFNMYGGEISGANRPYCVEVNSKGVFNMYGGAIKGNTLTYVPVYLKDSNSTFNMYSGEISGNTTSTGYSNSAGAVFLKGTDSVFNMYGGEITENTNDNGAVRVGNGTTFNMFGGKISKNIGVLAGAIYNNGVFNMEGGEITENYATGTTMVAGAVLMGSTTAEINLKKGSITGNVANWSSNTTYYAGGIYINEQSHPNAIINITGADVQIDNNYIAFYDSSTKTWGYKSEKNLGLSFTYKISTPLDADKTVLSLAYPAYNPSSYAVAVPDGTNLKTLEAYMDCFVIDEDKDEFLPVCASDGSIYTIKVKQLYLEMDSDGNLSAKYKIYDNIDSSLWDIDDIDIDYQ